MPKFLLITDLDNTLVGDDEALDQLNHKLTEHRKRYGSLLVYSTGRSRELYYQLRAEKSLLEPDALILAVGTLIFHKGSHTSDSTWHEILSQGWDRARIESITALFPELISQPASEQNEFKVSFYVKPEQAAVLIPRLKNLMLEHELDVQFVYSSNHDLDILPTRGNKGSALIFLRHALGMEREETVVCGDSGNDQAMFAVNESLGIIVGNAQSELLDWHHANPSTDRYLAKAHCAGGIIEGLHYFGLLD